MSTEFWIQANSPRWHAAEVLADATLDEWVEAVFARATEDAILVWRHVYIPLSYKYDVGTILRDILDMIERLGEREHGEWQVDWPSNTFGARWHFQWKAEHLRVTASEWRAVVGDTEELLRGRAVLEIDRSEFVAEWKALLERVQEALLGAGCTGAAFPELDRLVATVQSLSRGGVLYR